MSLVYRSHLVCKQLVLQRNCLPLPRQRLLQWAMHLRPWQPSCPASWGIPLQALWRAVVAAVAAAALLLMLLVLVLLMVHRASPLGLM